MSTTPVPFGSFTLLDPLAAGGMGEVWLAQPHDVPGAGDLCIVKRVKSNLTGDVDVLKRFLDEGRLSLLLDHPHVSRTVDVGRADDCDYLACELVEGLDARHLMKRAQEAGVAIDVDVVITLVADALDGLAYAHAAAHPLTQAHLGVVHRDISPQNLMIDHHGHTHVIDFGLALSSVRQAQTELGVVLGKIAYMAPEQARGERVDGACDVFAMGVVLYELLAGDRYWGAFTQAEIWQHVGRGVHVPARLAALDDELRPIVEAMTHPDVRERPSSSLARDALLTLLWRHGEEKRGRERLRALVARLATSELSRVARARELARTVSSTTTTPRAPTTLSLAQQEVRAVEAMVAARAHTPSSMPTTAPTVELPRTRPRVPTAPSTLVLERRATEALPSSSLSSPSSPSPSSPSSPSSSRARPPAAAPGLPRAALAAAVLVCLAGAALAWSAFRPPPPSSAARTTAPPASATAPAAPVTPAPATTAHAAPAPAPPAPSPPAPATPPAPTSPEGLVARIQRLQGCREGCAQTLRVADLTRLRASPQAARMALHRSVSLCEQACRR